MKRLSGQLASAAPRAPTPTGRPAHVLVPVMLAAMMPPTAMMMEWPALPQTWATKSVVMSFARPGGEADVVVREGMEETRAIVSRAAAGRPDALPERRRSDYARADPTRNWLEAAAIDP